MKRYIHILLFILTATMMYSCSTSKHGRKNSTNFSSFSRTENSFVNVFEASPRVLNDSEMEILYRISPSKMLSSGTAYNKNTSLQILFHYTVMSDDKSHTILDTGTFKIENTNRKYEWVEYNSHFKNHNLNSILVYYDIYDPAEQLHYKNTIPFNLESIYSGQYFSITDSPLESNSVFERSFNSDKKSLRIYYFNNNIKNLYLRYSMPIGQPAPPPFYQGKMQVPVAKFGKTSTISNGSSLEFNGSGNYLIQADTTKKEGLWLNSFHSGFPYPSTTNDYIDPLIYLCSTDEFDNIKNNENRKKAVDDFWNKCTESEERGPLLADDYYKRVKEANESFSTSKEGWKTDRGMIYIVFGKPDELYKTSWGENWVYNAHYPFPAVEYHFTRSLQPWGYDFTLMRDESLRSLWYLGVDAWRNGRSGRK